MKDGRTQSGMYLEVEALLTTIESLTVTSVEVHGLLFKENPIDIAERRCNFRLHLIAGGLAIIQSKCAMLRKVLAFLHLLTAGYKLKAHM